MANPSLVFHSPLPPLVQVSLRAGNVALMILAFRLRLKKESHRLSAPKFSSPPRTVSLAKFNLFILCYGRLRVLFITRLSTRIPFLYEVYRVVSFYPKMSSHKLLSPCDFISLPRFPVLFYKNTLPLFESATVCVYLNSVVVNKEWTRFLPQRTFFLYSTRAYFCLPLMENLLYQYYLVYRELPSSDLPFFDPISHYLSKNIPTLIANKDIRSMSVLRDSHKDYKNTIDWYDSFCKTENNNTRRVKKREIRWMFGIDNEELKKLV